MTEPASIKTCIMSATVSTFVYSVCLTPFDVVKNTQISSMRRTNPIYTGLELFKQNGVRTLWRGLLTASLTTFSSNIIYYPLYETLKFECKKASDSFGYGMAALISRFIAVLITLPVERLRTSIQGTGSGEFEVSYKGLRCTMIRDLIFSFTYFQIFESLTRKTNEKNVKFGRFYSILAGSLVAAVITHPFDVVKTKIQTRYCCYKEFDKQTFMALREIYGNEGIKGLYVGAQARISKIVIGLVIFMNVYEAIKDAMKDK